MGPQRRGKKICVLDHNVSSFLGLITEVALLREHGVEQCVLALLVHDCCPRQRSYRTPLARNLKLCTSLPESSCCTQATAPGAGAARGARRPQRPILCTTHRRQCCAHSSANQGQSQVLNNSDCYLARLPGCCYDFMLAKATAHPGQHGIPDQGRS